MASVRMSRRDDFDDGKSLTKYLAEQLMQGRLALFLGAGISVPFGLPNWKKLVKQLYASQRQSPPSKKSFEQQAELFRIKYYSNDRTGFITAVRKALYAGVHVDLGALRTNGTLAALGTMMMASRRGAASSVVTFNYDDLIEMYLAYHGLVTESVYGIHAWSPRTDVAIYHPHGFVPYDNRRAASDEIILDQKSYSKTVGDAANVWAQRLLTIMRSNTCVFVGLGGTDCNLDSLLLKSKEGHASLNEQTAFWGVTFTTDPSPDAVAIWEDRGVYGHRISDFTIDLPNFLFDVVQKAAELRQASI